MVFKKFNFDLVQKSILIGIFFNLLYGLTELLIPKLPSHDKIFHNLGKSVYQEYFLYQTDRIRMLWTEPSFAGVYITSFVLPIVLLKNSKILLTIILFSIIFVAPKGSIVMIVLSSIVIAFVNFHKHLYKIFVIFISSLLLFLLVRFIGIYYSFGIFKNLEHILDFFKNSFIALVMENNIGLYESVLSSGIGGSQLIRFHNIKIHLELLLTNFNILVFGSSAYGNKLYVNKLCTEKLDIIPGYPMSYSSTNELFYAKDSTGSDFLNYYFWYGSPIIVFILFLLFGIHKYGTIHFSYQNKLYYFNIVFLTLIFNLFFLLSYHSLQMLFVLYLYFKFKSNNYITSNKT